MKRPTGVTLLAVLGLASGALALFAAVVVLATMQGPPPTEVPPWIPPENVDAWRQATQASWSLEIATLAVYPIMGLANLALGYGLWLLRRWARTALIAYAAIGIVLGAIMATNFYVMFSEEVSPAVLGIVLIPLAVNWAIIWYMRQPHVTEAFGVQPSQGD